MVVNSAEWDVWRSICLSAALGAPSFLKAALKPPGFVLCQCNLWVASSRAAWDARRVPVLSKAWSCPAQDAGAVPGRSITLCARLAVCWCPLVLAGMRGECSIPCVLGFSFPAPCLGPTCQAQSPPVSPCLPTGPLPFGCRHFDFRPRWFLALGVVLASWLLVPELSHGSPWGAAAPQPPQVHRELQFGPTALGQPKGTEHNGRSLQGRVLSVACGGSSLGAPLLPRAGRHLGRAVVCCLRHKARPSFNTRVADPGCQLHVWKLAPVVWFQALKHPCGFQFGPKLISVFKTILSTPPSIKRRGRWPPWWFPGKSRDFAETSPLQWLLGAAGD